MAGMSKTPDEIKKGLETCSTKDAECENCPYYDEKCTYDITSDSLAYIQQLERDKNWLSENYELIREENERLEAQNTELLEKIKQLEKKP